MNAHDKPRAPIGQGMEEIQPPYDDRISETPLRRFRFSLRACFALTAICAFFAWGISFLAPEFKIIVPMFLAGFLCVTSFVLFGIRK